MAISGLHVGLIVTMMCTLVSLIWRQFPQLLLRFPAPRMATLVALLVASMYGILAGFSLPTQRAVIMLTVVLGGSLLARPVPLWRRLLLAGAIIIVWQPFALWSASLWLSFVAVAWIAYGMGGRIKPVHGVKALVRLQGIIFLGLLPLTLSFFQQVSWVTLIANFIAIPWIGMVIVPLCFFAALTCCLTTTLGGWLFGLAAKLLTPLWWWLQWLASWPHAVWHYALSSPWVLLSSMVAISLLLAPAGWPGRWLGIVWGLPLFFAHGPAPAKQAIWLTLLDVGQGLATIVRTAHHVLVYDAGPHFYAGFDAGQSILVPYLRHWHIHRIDTLVISHGDNDHSGGAQAALHELVVTKLLTSVPQRFAGHADYCHAGQHWRWDGVDFRMLAPPQGEPYQGNNSSCVLQIDNSHARVLLTGDIGRARERWLLAQHDQLHAQIIVVPHHGSQSSSSPAFVTAVDPSDALFSIGYDNRYHFPSPQVVARYRQVGARIFSSARDGAIMLHIDACGRIHSATANEIHYFWQQ